MLLLLILSLNVDWLKYYGFPWWGRDIGKCSFKCSNGYIVFGNSDDKTYLVRIDENGDTLWTKKIGGGLISVEEAIDGGYIVICEKAPHYYAEKIGEFGNVMWEKELPETGYYSYYQPVIIRSDSGYAVLRMAFDTVSGDCGMALLNADMNFNIMWEKIYFPPPETSFGFDKDFCKTKDGFVIVGEKYPGGTFVMKVDKSGNIIWNKNYPHFTPYDIITTSDSFYVIVGEKDKDIYLLKLDKNGDTLWSKRYGDTLTDCGYCVKEIPSGYIIGGFTTSQDTDFYLLKVDKDGNIIWSKIYQRESIQKLYDVLIMDNGFLLTGYYRFDENPYEEVYIMLVDTNGAPMWEKTFGYPRGCESGIHVIRTFDGNFVIVGLTERCFGGHPFYHSHLWVLKINADGDTLFNRKYKIGENTAGLYVEEDSDSGLIICGIVDTAEDGIENYDLLIMKLDKYGNLVWYRNFDAGMQEEGLEIHKTSDGGYIVVGNFGPYLISYGGPYYKSKSSYYVYLVKLDKEGNLEWSKTYSFADDWTGWSVVEDSGFVVSGYIFRDHPFPLLFKCDYNGNLIWYKIYDDSSQSPRGEIYRMLKTEDGYILCGNSIHPMSGSYNFRVLLMKVDKSGEILWLKEYGPDTTPIACRGLDVRFDDAGYIICGLKGYFECGGINSPDIYVVKVDSQGNLILQGETGEDWMWIQANSIQPFEGGYIVCGFGRSEIYPSDGIIVLRISNIGMEENKKFNDIKKCILTQGIINFDSKINLKLYDITGRCIKNISETRILNIKDLPQGIYFLHTKREDKKDKIKIILIK